MENWRWWQKGAGCDSDEVDEAEGNNVLMKAFLAVILTVTAGFTTKLSVVHKQVRWIILFLSWSFSAWWKELNKNSSSVEESCLWNLNPPPQNNRRLAMSFKNTTAHGIHNENTAHGSGLYEGLLVSLSFIRSAYATHDLTEKHRSKQWCVKHHMLLQLKTAKIQPRSLHLISDFIFRTNC